MDNMEKIDLVEPTDDSKQIEKKNNWSSFFAKYATVITLALIIVIFTFTTKNFRFIQPENLINILRQVSILSIVALGFTVSMASGEIDMSTGPVVGLAGVLAIGLIANQHLPVWAAVLVVIVAGLFVGVVNSFITTKLRIPSLIVTLAMQSIVTGMIYLYSGGKSLYGSVPNFFVIIGQGSFLGVPWLVIIMILFAAITYFILNKTIVGRYIYATGGNKTTARFSGINTTKYKYIGLMMSAGFAAFAGILLAARLGSGQPAAGDSFTMDAMSAVFVGMTTIRIGRANVVGTIVGVFLIGIISNGLNLLGWSYFFQDMAKGVIMIAAVAFAASRSELKLL